MRLGTAHGSGRPKIAGYINISGPQSDDCGLPANVVEMFKDPATQEVAVVCAGTTDGHDFEGFTIYGRFEDDPAYRKPKYDKEADLLKEETVRAWFVSAGFSNPTKMHCLVNGYDPERDDRWWLVKVDQGFVKIGWRKRVINIDWSDTPLRKVITIDDVTKDEDMVHAWSVAKAIEYLTEIRRSLKELTT